MSARHHMPTLLPKNWPASNAIKAMTGFGTGLGVGWCVIAWLPSPIHNSLAPHSDRGNRKKYFTRILMHTISFSLLSCTKSRHYNAIFCKALLFFSLCPKNQTTYWQFFDVLPTCFLAGWNEFFSQCQVEFFDILMTWQHLPGQHVIWGVLATQHNADISF